MAVVRLAQCALALQGMASLPIAGAEVADLAASAPAPEDFAWADYAAPRCSVEEMSEAIVQHMTPACQQAMSLALTTGRYADGDVCSCYMQVDAEVMENFKCRALPTDDITIQQRFVQCQYAAYKYAASSATVRMRHKHHPEL